MSGREEATTTRRYLQVALRPLWPWPLPQPEVRRERLRVSSVISTVERNYVESAVMQARKKAATAKDIADVYNLDDIAERVLWALDALDAALAKLMEVPTRTTG